MRPTGKYSRLSTLCEGKNHTPRCCLSVRNGFDAEGCYTRVRRTPPKPRFAVLLRHYNGTIHVPTEPPKQIQATLNRNRKPNLGTQSQPRASQSVNVGHAQNLTLLSFLDSSILNQSEAPRYFDPNSSSIAILNSIHQHRIRTTYIQKTPITPGQLSQPVRPLSLAKDDPTEKYLEGIVEFLAASTLFHGSLAMSRPPASHYSRLVHRQLRPQRTNSQSQEKISATTIPHRCTSNHTPVRHGHSVPGPLEGRTRMGRRRMGGGLHSTLQPGPLWEFENAIDLSQWQWRPPKSPEARKIAQQRSSNDAQSTSFAQLSRWFLGSESSSEQPFSQIDQFSTAAEALVSGPQYVETVEPWVATGRPRTGVSSPEVLVQEGLDILKTDIVNADILMDSVSPIYGNLDRFCESLEQNLLGDNLSDRDIHTICRDMVTGVWALYEQAWTLHQCRKVEIRKVLLPITSRDPTSRREDAYRGQKPTQKLLDKKTLLGATEKATMQLLATIVRGLSTRVSRVQRPCDYEIWGLLIHHVSSWERNNVRLFCQIMSNIPDHHIGKLSRSLTKYLQESMVAMGTDMVPHSTVMRQINDLSSSFARVDHQRLVKILDGVTQKLSKIDTRKSSRFPQHNVDVNIYSKYGIPEAELLKHDIREAELIEHGLREAQLFQREIIQDQLLHDNISEAGEICHDIREAQRSLQARNFTTTRFAWLQLLARLPGVDEKCFTGACVSLVTGPGSPPLTRLEVCRLFVAHAKSQGKLDRPDLVYESIKKWDVEKKNGIINPGAIYCQTKQAWLVGDLYRFMKAVRRSQDAISMVKQLKPLVPSEIRPLVHLSIMTQQWELVLDILAKHGLDRATGAGKRGFWQSPLATRTLTVLVSHPLVEHDAIFKALGIRSRPRQRRHQYPRPWSRAPSYLRHQMRKVQRLAEAISNSPNMPERKALDLLQKCVHYTRSQDAQIPGALLKILYHHITKDLQRGQPGRTSRLRWFLHLLYKQRGYEKMMETGLFLTDLRKQIFSRQNDH